jgi:aspartyl-tRNA(Asn)/glutamyl-tRNA(Gln) amidotransferase subunit B|tara:strand:+ start:240 stop:1703 length:1464 start_codon:yes stop_codon:yes gene_type:complete
VAESNVSAAGFEPVIGLEIHAQLLTATKAFCGCGARFGGAPNAHVCPVCLGLPGALPVLNRRAVELAMRAGLALGCTIQHRSIFARKNYFYPDLPKGYQISQYERPLATDGELVYEADDGPHATRILRVHLEEDAGKSLHVGTGDGDRHTYLDFNRSGVPLIEIVTHPDLRSPREAADFFVRLRAILLAIGVNDGNMEEGSLRCDANVSIRPVGTSALGVKVEVKNLNSFRFLQRAIEHELVRQSEQLNAGAEVVQETRLWDEAAGRTASMRSKEEAHDYRYFPEPDLPPLEVSDEWIADVRAGLPELPDARKQRFMRDYGLSATDAAQLADTAELARFFEATAASAGNPKAACNWVMGEVTRRLKVEDAGIEAVGVSPDALGRLIRLVDTGVINGSAAKSVFDHMYGSGREPDDIVQTEALAQIGDEGELNEVVARVIAEHTDAVARYLEGNEGSLGFLVGQVMRATRGRANPKLANELLRRTLAD